MRKISLRLNCLLIGGLLSLAVEDLIGQTPAAETSEIQAVVEGFHRALIQGERTAALALLAADAIILESGESEQRTNSRIVSAARLVAQVVLLR